MLGGGYVGLEMAQAYRRFGSRVTIIEHGPQLVGREDPDVAAELLEMLRDEGIEVHLEPRCSRCRAGPDRQSASACARRQANRPSKAATSWSRPDALPTPPGSGSIVAGVELDERGYIAVNDRLETSAPDVWAIGECAGSPQFTHVSFDDFRIIRDNLAGGNRSTRDRLVPYCMFTDPPLARVGLSEARGRSARASPCASPSCRWPPCCGRGRSRRRAAS